MVEQQCVVKIPISIDGKQCLTNTINPDLPRLHFYEPTGMYIVTALLLILYIAVADVHFAFDGPPPYVPLIAALLTLLPYLFRHRFDCMPNLFHQVFCFWASLTHNLTLFYYYLLIDEDRIYTNNIKDLLFVAFLTYSLFPLLIFQTILSIYTLKSFKDFYRKHLLVEVLPLKYFSIIRLLNTCVFFVAGISFFPWLFCGVLIERNFWGTKYYFKYRGDAIMIIASFFNTYCHARITRLLEYIDDHFTRKQDLPRLANGVPVFPPVFFCLDCCEGRKVSPMPSEV